MEGTLTTNSKKVKAFITHFLHYEDLCSINYSKKKKNTMTTGFNRSNQMLTQISNKEKKRKKQKQRSIDSPWVENP